MKKKAFILLADGFEEIEALAPIDILKRAKVDVKLLAIGDSDMVTSSLGVVVKAEGLLKDHLDELPHLVLTPGGGLGSENLKKSKLVTDLLKRQNDAGKWIASICASPIALDEAGVLDGKNFTCYPGTEASINSGKHIAERIVVDGNLVTAQGPGVALDFGYKVVELLLNKAAADLLRNAMLAE